MQRKLELVCSLAKDATLDPQFTTIMYGDTQLHGKIEKALSNNHVVVVRKCTTVYPGHAASLWTQFSTNEVIQPTCSVVRIRGT